MTPHPPLWAQSLAGFVTPARHRDGILGDLLEEYHEVQHPRRGEAGADAWYVRQVLLFLWRAARWWGLGLGALIVARDAIDVYAPTNDYHLRSAWTTYSAVALYSACGVRAGWYYRRVLSGTVVGITSAIIASAVSLLVPLLFLHAIAGRPELSEILDVPVPFLVLFGAIFSSLGAGIARGGGALRGVTWG